MLRTFTLLFLLLLPPCAGFAIDPNGVNTIPRYLYKVISSDAWRKSCARRELHLPPMDEPFIHLATREQLPKILAKFWGEEETIILKLESAKLVGELRLEKNPGGDTLYYHLYRGRIPFESIAGVETRESGR